MASLPLREPDRTRPRPADGTVPVAAEPSLHPGRSRTAASLHTRTPSSSADRYTATGPGYAGSAIPTVDTPGTRSAAEHPSSVTCSPEASPLATPPLSWLCHTFIRLRHLYQSRPESRETPAPPRAPALRTPARSPRGADAESHPLERSATPHCGGCTPASCV